MDRIHILRVHRRDIMDSTEWTTDKQTQIIGILKDEWKIVIKIVNITILTKFELVELAGVMRIRRKKDSNRV